MNGPNLVAARNKPQLIISQTNLIVFGTAEYSEALVNYGFEVEANLPHHYGNNVDLVLTMDKNFCRYKGNFSDLKLNIRTRLNQIVY